MRLVGTTLTRHVSAGIDDAFRFVVDVDAPVKLVDGGIGQWWFVPAPAGRSEIT